MTGSLWQKILAFLEELFGKIKADFEPFVKQYASDAGEILLQAAEAAVTALAASVMTGPEKRDAAFKQILADLQSKGIKLGESAINGAIEIMVAKMKSAQASNGQSEMNL